MPGIKNNLSEKLEKLSQQTNETESLLQTIRCPRNLGSITERLPKPQYIKVQRSNSLSIEDSIAEKIPDVDSRAPSTPKEVGGPTGKLMHRGLKGAREKGLLPIIAEDTVLEDTVVLTESPMALVAQSKPISSQN